MLDGNAKTLPAPIETRPGQPLPTLPRAADEHPAAPHRPATGRARPRGLGVIGVIVVIAAIGAATYGIISRQATDREVATWTDAQAVPTVKVEEPKHGSADNKLVLPGNVEAFYEAPIFSRVQGYLQAWYFDIGAQVKAGAVLALIDTPELDEQLSQARADLAVAKARAQFADLTAKRWNALRGSNSISVQSADEKQGESTAAQAEVNARQAGVQRLLALSSFKKLTAPFDGIVTTRNTDIGALINVGSNAGLPLFKVADAHEMRVYVRVPQSYASQLSIGMKATLTQPQYPGVTFPAEIASLANAVNVESRTVLVQLQAANPDGKLWTGTYAQVAFQLPRDENMLRVPTAAMIFRQAGAQLAVLGPDNKAVFKNVTIGRNFGAEAEILSGLAADDRVIVGPPDTLRPGDAVRLAEQKAPDAPKTVAGK